MASSGEGRAGVVFERCNFIFQLLVLWAERGNKPSETCDEQGSGFGLSRADDKIMSKPRYIFAE